MRERIEPTPPEAIINQAAKYVAELRANLSQFRQNHSGPGHKIKKERTDKNLTPNGVQEYFILRCEIDGQQTQEFHGSYDK